MSNTTVEKKTIVKSLILSILIGGFIVVAAVLPAEYGVDPLGLGKAIGFSKLYVNKSATELQTVAATAVNHKKITINNVGSPSNVERPKNALLPEMKEKQAVRSDEISVVVPAQQGIEYKFQAKQLGKVEYEWSTEQGELYIDFHGEPKNAKGFYESYTVCYSNNMGGMLLVPFTGKHGWYFRNNSDKDITVKIKLHGQYKI